MTRDDGGTEDPFGVSERADAIEPRTLESRRLGKVISTVSRTARRLLRAHVAIMEGPPDGIEFQHTVFCQTSLPYRPTDARTWEREQGAVSLLIEAGRVRDPATRRWMDLPLPHGEKPRLVLIHLNREALRTGSPMIDVQDSMTAFVRALGIDTNGRNLRTLKDQLARLSAATVRLAVTEDGRDVQINTHIVGAFDLWFPKDERQRVLWPTTVRLSDDYFASLTQHAVPLDNRAVAALSGSALCLDIYAWLAQRLHRVPRGRAQTVTWPAMKGQFGPDYAHLRQFRAKFIHALRQVLTVYPGARVEVTEVGLVLRTSPPPVTRRILAMPGIGPMTIEGRALDVADNDA